MPPDVQALEDSIGHRFGERAILERALTHSSHKHERAPRGTAPACDNEQLEFLGDAVLGLLVSELLVGRFPDYSEGRLSKLKAYLVSAACLEEVARRLDLGSYLQLGRGEEMSGGRAKRTLLVNGLEALLGALYLDAGLESARRFVERFVMEHPAELEARVAPQAQGIDFKTALQELARARGLALPRYAVVSEKGPEHLKMFTVEARIGRELAGRGEGFSKKSAAQTAARELYGKLLEGGQTP
ncbi:MAG: ribonuclease III [Acidobacteria bacterium]|nr:ribonuclease III [Acidobacteriota bacterium]